MTHAHSRDNEAKRGARWMLFHCALCGDLLPRYRVEVRTRSAICPCTDQLQKARRWGRKYSADQAALDAKRAAAAPVTRPDRSDRDTKLGA